jgi:recombinational DNA repair protein RecT
MTTETRLKRSEVEKLTLTQIVDDERVKSRFVELFNARNRTKDGAALYTMATESFLRAIQEDQNLQQCTPISLYNAFLDMAYYGITVAKAAQPLAYLLWNNVNTGTKESPAWEKRATLTISPYGELAIRQSMNQIKHADNPIVVYEDDEYSGIVYKDGQKTVNYKKNLKSKNRKIVAAFIKITRHDGSIDFVETDMAQIARLAGYSNRKNFNKGANALYSSNAGQIDEGFLTAKLIKHAFKTYPRVNNPHSAAAFQTEQVETEVEEVEDIYGMDDDSEIPAADVEDVVDAKVMNDNGSF